MKILHKSAFKVLINTMILYTVINTNIVLIFDPLSVAFLRNHFTAPLSLHHYYCYFYFEQMTKL